MTSIRTSVHDLHDNAVDLKGAVCDILNHTADFETSLEYDMSAVIPKDIKYCFYIHCQRSCYKYNKKQQWERHFCYDSGTSRILPTDNR